MEKFEIPQSLLDGNSYFFMGHAVTGVALQAPVRRRAIRSSFVQGIKPCPTEQLLSPVLLSRWKIGMRRASGYALRANDLRAAALFPCILLEEVPEGQHSKQRLASKGNLNRGYLHKQKPTSVKRRPAVGVKTHSTSVYT